MYVESHCGYVKSERHNYLKAQLKKTETVQLEECGGTGWEVFRLTWATLYLNRSLSVT